MNKYTGNPVCAAIAKAEQELRDGDISGFTVTVWTASGLTFEGAPLDNSEEIAADKFLAFNDDGSDHSEFILLSAIIAIRINRL